MQNEFSVLCLPIDLESELAQAVHKAKQRTSKLKKSFLPYGVLTLSKLMNLLPPIVCQKAQQFFLSKQTLFVSNVPGPLQPLTFDYNLRSKEITGFLPGIGDMAFGISAVSHVDNLSMAISADKSYLKDTELLKRLIEANYTALHTLFFPPQNSLS